MWELKQVPPIKRTTFGQFIQFSGHSTGSNSEDIISRLIHKFLDHIAGP